MCQHLPGKLNKNKQRLHTHSRGTRVCVSYPGNVEIFLRLHVCTSQRHTHQHDEGGGVHGGEESEEAGRSEAIPARASEDGVQVLSGHSQTWANVCAPHPPTSSAANHCQLPANTGPVFGRARLKQPRLDLSCFQEQWGQSADDSLHQLTFVLSQDTKKRKLNTFGFSISPSFGLKISPQRLQFKKTQ